MATPSRSCGAYRLCWQHSPVQATPPPDTRPNRTAFERPSFNCAPPGNRQPTALRVVDCAPVVDCEVVGCLTSA